MISKKFKQQLILYTNPFEKKQFYKTVAVEALSIALIIFCILIYGFMINSAVEQFVDSYQTTNLESVIYSGDNALIDAFGKDIQSLFFKTVISSVVLIGLIIAAYAFSRKWTWDILTSKTNSLQKGSWKKWSLFLIMETIIVAIVAGILVLLKTLFLYLLQQVFNFFPESVAFNVLDKLLIAVIAFVLMYSFITLNAIFYQQQLIFKTIGDWFSYCKTAVSNLKYLLVSIFLFVILNSVILSIINLIARNQTYLNVIFQIIIFAIATSYLRFQIYHSSKKQLNSFKA